MYIKSPTRQKRVVEVSRFQKTTFSQKETLNSAGEREKKSIKMKTSGGCSVQKSVIFFLTGDGC